MGLLHLVAYGCALRHRRFSPMARAAWPRRSTVSATAPDRPEKKEEPTHEAPRLNRFTRSNCPAVRGLMSEGREQESDGAGPEGHGSHPQLRNRPEHLGRVVHYRQGRLHAWREAEPVRRGMAGQ